MTPVTIFHRSEVSDRFFLTYRRVCFRIQLQHFMLESPTQVLKQVLRSANYNAPLSLHPSKKGDW